VPAVLAGLEQHQAGNLAGAHRAYQAVLRDDPDDFHAHLWLGALLQQSGRSESALPHLQRATVLGSAIPDGWVNLATAQVSLDDFDAALVSLEKALALDAGLAATWITLGNVHQARGALTEATEAYEKAAELAPDDPMPRFNLATIALRLGQYATAKRQVAASLDRFPNNAEALGLLADCELNLGAVDTALATLDRAQALAPQDANLWATRGVVLTDLGRLEEAKGAFDHALAADPDHGPALSQALFLRRRLCDWEAIDRLVRRFRDGVARAQEGLTPFSWLAEDSSRAEQQACARTWSRRWPELAGGPEPAPEVRDGRITVAYLSADYYRHPTAYLAAGLFEVHDRGRFRILGISNSRDEDSDIRRRLEAGFDQFIDIRHLAPAAAARRLRDEGVDILVDLKGHTLEAAPALMAQRAAPIQVQYLGYPGTLGASWADYVLGDHWVTPAAHQGDYDEHLVQLSGSYQVNDRLRPRPSASGSRSDFGLPTDAPVFCCFNNPWKLNERVFTTWLRLLAEVPDSVLWLLGRESLGGVATRLRKRAQDAGIDPARLVFSKTRPLEAYLALFHHADLFLDTWPYNAHTTASDALWMGCPVITLVGPTFAGRVGASLLAACGLEALITQDVDDYRERAKSLVAKRADLRALRESLLAGRDSLPLFDTERTTRQLEAAFEEMVRRHRAGQAGPFAVDSLSPRA
jgi:predicted O-linked N-acetylglucosamine transferase (SPINDLY family)